MDKFFQGEPTLEKLKTLTGLYAVPVPQTYPCFYQLIRLVKESGAAVTFVMDEGDVTMNVKRVGDLI